MFSFLPFHIFSNCYCSAAYKQALGTQGQHEKLQYGKHCTRKGQSKRADRGDGDSKVFWKCGA